MVIGIMWWCWWCWPMFCDGNVRLIPSFFHYFNEKKLRLQCNSIQYLLFFSGCSNRNSEYNWLPFFPESKFIILFFSLDSVPFEHNVTNALPSFTSNVLIKLSSEKKLIRKSNVASVWPIFLLLWFNNF